MDAHCRHGYGDSRKIVGKTDEGKDVVLCRDCGMLWEDHEDQGLHEIGAISLCGTDVFLYRFPEDGP